MPFAQTNRWHFGFCCCTKEITLKMSFYKMISLLLLFLMGCSYCLGDERVRFAAVLYRHGDRTPVETYPKDPWRNESLWPVKFGELTNIGKQQHYALGKWLRKRYLHLLSVKFDPTEIYIRSTDVDRTLMSAQANLAGMYPPVGKSVWNPDLMWQPIPIHTVPDKEDEILAMNKPCPAYNQEYKKVTNSKDYREKLSKYNKLMAYLTENTGKQVKDYGDILEIYNILYIEKLYNFTLPDWTHSVFPDALKKPSGYCFSINTSTPVLARLKAGPLLKQITSMMINVMDDERVGLSAYRRHPKVLIYSAHDLTVANVLGALGMYDEQCPVYTSTVFFELIQDNVTSDHFIRISYRNSTSVVEPHVLNIPNCGELCPIDRFVYLYDNLLSVNWDYECEKQFPALLGMSFIIGLALFATIYISHKVHFARVSRQHRLNMVYTSLPPQTLTPTATPDKLDNV